MKSKLFFLTLFLILFSSFVTADKIIEFQQTGELFIAYPPSTNFKQGIPFNLTFMVHNSTGGLETSTTCIVNVVDDKQNIIIYNTTLSVDSTGIQLLEINNTIVDVLGDYNYHLYCVNSETGFLVGGFHITRTGESAETMFDVVISYVFGVIALLGLLSYIVFKLDNKHIVLKVFVVSFAVYVAALIPRVLFLYDPTSIGEDLLKYYLRFIYIYSTYLFLAFIWIVAEYYGKTSGIKEWIKVNIGRKGYD